MKLRAWKEFMDRRTVMATSDGPIVAERGDVVMVVVAESWDAAARVIAQLDKPIPEGGK